MTDHTHLARRAFRAAVEVRRRANERMMDPICIYDVGERLGLEIKFFAGTSFGGVYTKTSQTILVPSLRPAGRQAFTCAHEVGHWFFGHGTRIDDLNAVEFNGEHDPEEYLANVFAGYLLMPPRAVNDAFKRRGWNPEVCTALQAYTVAVQLGVGYGTLVSHLQWSLGIISAGRSEELLKTSPKQLRESLLGSNEARHLVIADREWRKVPVDLQMTDMAILPAEVILEGKSVTIIGCTRIWRWWKTVMWS